MVLSIIISSVTVLAMIVDILFFSKIKIGKHEIDSYWIIVLLGALALVICGRITPVSIFEKMTENSAINPLKILILFISMTVISIYLDELGFFRYLANVTLKKSGTSQVKLFLYLYLVVSVLTVFTSNDIIILSFTPLICYFSKNARVNPIPYLAGEFVAANTWSMALIIGNPTNIYLATANGITFVEYLKVMIIPTIASGICAFGMLYLMFRKSLREPIKGEAEDVVIEDRTLLIVGVAHLAVCTILLAVSSYIGIEMWIISLALAVSLFVTTLIISAVRKKPPVTLAKSLKRAPWQLIPFVLSMFIIILTLTGDGVTQIITHILGTESDFFTVYRYGISSFVFANIINNIPMSVLFNAVLEPLEGTARVHAVYATIAGSNIGAFMTPIGALAGIMWGSIISKHGIKFGYKDFLKLGAVVAIPTIIVCLLFIDIVV